MSEVIPLEPTIIAIFGITGDLSKKYLLPALYHLFKVGLLSSQTIIVGVTRQAITADQLLSETDLCHEEENRVCDPEVEAKLKAQMYMVQMDLDNEAAYHQLAERLQAIEDEQGVCMNRLFYLSIPPKVYAPIVQLLGKAGLQNGCSHGNAKSRLLVEKPFGYDMSSAQGLITDIGSVFAEDQLFRIDHYLAKETVQNILTFRFENPIFEALWNKDHISAIEICASEQIGIMGRKVFYEPLGALRDFIQSHLLQILAIVTMDQPEVMESDHIHEKKQMVLDQFSAVDMHSVPVNAVRGQYEGYKTEVDNPESTTETFAGVRFWIQNERWDGVPISIWTGKSLDNRQTEIIVTFKNGDRKPNKLRFRISPHEGIEIELLAKKPGYAADLQPALMDFSYDNSFDDHAHPNAYERVLVDAVRGDHTLFATSQEVMAAWRVVQPVLDNWGQKGGEGLQSYTPGMSGSELAKPVTDWGEF